MSNIRERDSIHKLRHHQSGTPCSIKQLTPLLICVGLAACAVKPAAPHLKPHPQHLTTPAFRPKDVAVVAITPEPITDDSVVCRDEVITGSHIPRRRCMTRRQIREARIRAQNWLRTRGFGGYSAF